MGVEVALSKSSPGAQRIHLLVWRQSRPVPHT
ncbi:hypothetical protein LCGC14_2689780, partial [marine sediment metagenome]